MRNRLRKILLTYSFIVGMSLVESNDVPSDLIHIELEGVEIVGTLSLYEHCLIIAKRLDQIGYLSISPDKFAEAIYRVALCESGLNPKAKGKDGAGSHGLWQMTTETRKILKVRKGNSLSHQAENYYKFLKRGGKKRIRGIQNSVDLHCYNFAPGRDKNGVLSRVFNPQLEALDKNKDSIITRQDFILFQRQRIKV